VQVNRNLDLLHQILNVELSENPAQEVILEEFLKLGERERESYACSTVALLTSLCWVLPLWSYAGRLQGSAVQGLA
jgi:hypothetical protein